MGAHLLFWQRVIQCAIHGGRKFKIWMGCLTVVLVYGLYEQYHHLADGLIITNMNDSVSWGIGIANFVYFVGVGAAAVVLVAPSYAWERKDIKEVVLLGEVLAFVAITLCLLFIMIDMGRPDRLWHLMRADKPLPYLAAQLVPVK